MCSFAMQVERAVRRRRASMVSKSRGRRTICTLRVRQTQILFSQCALRSAHGLLYVCVCVRARRSHFLLIRLLLPKLLATATAARPARVVSVSSLAHMHAKGIVYDRLRDVTDGTLAMQEYAQSKMAQVMMSAHLQAHLPAARDGLVRFNSCHPGVVASEIWREGEPAVTHLVLYSTRRSLTHSRYRQCRGCCARSHSSSCATLTKARSRHCIVCAQRSPMFSSTSIAKYAPPPCAAHCPLPWCRSVCCVAHDARRTACGAGTVLVGRSESRGIVHENLRTTWHSCDAGVNTPAQATPLRSRCNSVC